MTPPPDPAPPAELSPANLAYVEALWERWSRDPDAVDPAWREWFAAQERDARGAAPRTAERDARLGPRFTPPGLFAPGSAGRNGHGAARGEATAALQDRIDQLIRAYRVRGHLLAELDPLGLPRAPQRELELDYYGLGEEHLDLRFSSGTVQCEGRPTLGDILTRLQNTYCRSIGAQFMHIDELAVKEWLQTRMEGTENRLVLDRAEQLRILTKLTDAVIFEEFIQRKYLGAKRFSLEGGESLVPLLDLAVEKAGEQGLDELVLAMAHRGRLNVLANVTGKSPRQIFHEFEDDDPEQRLGSGDVKYHLGYSCEHETRSGRKLHLSLCFNPSHLEIVNPVALGRVRAKQDREGDADGSRCMAILIHGDAAIIGEGVTQETLNLSQLAGYKTGGALHVVVNNQIGFTTGPPEARSTTYATSVAKMLASPIFHVNGEDPEAVAQVVKLAMEFRHEWRRDVVIDMYCYRRYGHNEGDEPAFTQPLLYTAIRRRKSVRQGYLEHLLAHGQVAREEADEIRERRRADLEEELTAAREPGYEPRTPPQGTGWEAMRGGPEAGVEDVDTAVDAERLGELLAAQTRLPIDFRPHDKIRRLLDERAEMARGERPLNWSGGEALAFASLAVDGYAVRLTGQDTVRGTFSQRHAALHDQEDGHAYLPLQHLTPDQARVDVVNSPLSEMGVLGFEYGYSMDAPGALVLWEAQFGDFNNVAQVVIDQFITSAEDKWRRLSGLVLLLPHGFEGMGPEHSSARLERFLTLAAEDNIQVVYPTTPAQYFHVLRRQVVRPWRKPLVVMTPKSLLRSAAATSTLADCATGRFQRVLADPREPDPAGVRRVVLCSGKVYYDLDARRTDGDHADVAVLRVEQLYPLADEVLAAALAPYAADVPCVWVQEEPENMGAWRTLRARFGERLLDRPFTRVSRPASASPATGSASAHKLEQERLVDAAFARD